MKRGYMLRPMRNLFRHRLTPLWLIGVTHFAGSACLSFGVHYNILSPGSRSVVSFTATSIANASMLRWNNLPPSAHWPPTQSKRAVEALPSGWPSNHSKPRTHERKTNNQPSRSFLAYLAFHSIFFQHESDGRGAYLSFLSQSALFFRKALRSQPRTARANKEFLSAVGVKICRGCP
jgi:hypothetical protein